MKKCTLLSALVFSFTLLFCEAESFRVAKTQTAVISSPSDTARVQCGIMDGLAIDIPQDLTYFSGIELNIKIPEVIAGFRNSVSYSVYTSVNPVPESGTIDYTATQLVFEPLPGSLSHTVIIPFTQEEKNKTTPYAKNIRQIPDLSSGKIFLRFQLSMKGVPESMYSSLFDITVKPVLNEKGRVAVKVKVPENLKDKPYSIYIDDRLSDENPQDLYSTGEHHVSIVSDDFRTEVRTFRIEQARTVTVNIELKDITPTVKFICPENARVIFDGTPVTNKKEELQIKAGEHSVKFLIGDYEIIKSLFAENGRSYAINLNVDAQITESE